MKLTKIYLEQRTKTIKEKINTPCKMEAHQLLSLRDNQAEILQIIDFFVNNFPTNMK